MAQGILQEIFHSAVQEELPARRGEDRQRLPFAERRLENAERRFVCDLAQGD